MFKTLAASVVLALLPACAAAPHWFPAALRAPGRSHDSQAPARFSFEWALSGSKEVAPLQVFDDGRRTWLQFAPGQPVPAIFELAAEGARLLSYTREEPYIVLPGVWPQLMFRGGALQGEARRTKANPAPDTPALDALAASLHDAPVQAPQPAEPPGAPAPLPVASAERGIHMLDAVLDTPADVAAAPHYEVSPRDLTLRAALGRWAQASGWTFQPEHWALDVDIPIVGSASFALPFKQAVQALVASTELADRPLQPCFYSNRVLRVVPYAQPCNRTAGGTRVS